MSELKPCPFCGKQPQVDIMGQIWCANKPTEQHGDGCRVFCKSKLFGWNSAYCWQREAALVREIEELKKHGTLVCQDFENDKLKEENAKLRSLVNRLAEKLRLLRHYDSGSHSPETVEDIIAEAEKDLVK